MKAPTYTVLHDSFSIERTYEASPERVFAAFADQKTKARWFSGPEGWNVSQWELDFRVGGREHNVSAPRGGKDHTFQAIYLDIVPDHRIIYTYDMFIGSTKLSCSLTTIELEPDPAFGRTRLLLTEQGAYLDGHDLPKNREQGTRELLEALARVL
jgi:uncharacterized protein YndB with AHSA1/START domain